MCLRRAMRAIRVLRILKLLRFMPSLRVLGRHCQRPPPADSLLFVYCYRDDRFGSLMYLIEGPKYGFTTLNASVYWAIVTVTTVGYGDITRIRRSDVLWHRFLSDRLFSNSGTNGANYHPYEQRLPEQQAATQMSELSAGES